MSENHSLVPSENSGNDGWVGSETTGTAPVFDEPPPAEVFQAFETLDAGKTTFTLAQLEAIQAVLEQYHHAMTW